MIAAASRRGFLKGFAAFSAGSVTVGTAVALEKPPSPDADLLRLDTDLSLSLAEYDAAFNAMADCRVRFEAAKPAIPAELKMQGFDGWVESEWPPSFEGRPCSKHVQNRIRVPSQYHLDHLLKVTDGRTIKGKLVRRTKLASDAYHAANDAARKAVGQEEICTAVFYKGRAVIDLGFKVMAIDAVTVEGLAVKGRAGLAMHRVWGDDGGRHIESSYQSLLLNLVALGGREASL